MVGHVDRGYDDQMRAEDDPGDRDLHDIGVDEMDYMTASSRRLLAALPISKGNGKKKGPLDTNWILRGPFTEGPEIPEAIPSFLGHAQWMAGIE